MTTRLYGLAAVGALVLSIGVLPANAQATFQGANWVWHAPDPGVALMDMPRGTCYLRAQVAISEKARIKSAEVIVTCDNLYTFFINGRFAGEGEPNPDAWNRPKRFDVASLLSAGHNTVAIEAANTAPGPAGLLFKMVVDLEDGQHFELATGPAWKATRTEENNWQQPEFNDQAWAQATVIAPWGSAPWGGVAAGAAKLPVGQRDAGPDAAPPADFVWPADMAFVGDDCSLYRPTGGTGNSYDSLSVTIFNPRDSRAFPEHDLPAPMKVGHKLYRLRSDGPDSKPTILFDAGAGAVGSPSPTFDGKALLISYVPAGEAFYHIYRLALDGTPPVQLTRGTHHDIDPAELPDGRIVFTSTRAGTFEEYHSPPSRALYTMQADGSDIRPLTRTFIFDNEPEVMADGRIIFIRSDNFFDRGKVETLLHAVHPDGTHGYTEFGLDLGPDYGGRLRAYNVGSPAPLPDGRVAFLTGSGVAIGRPGGTPGDIRHLNVEAGDVAAMPDGRLLVSLPKRLAVSEMVKGGGAHERTYRTLALVDPSQAQPGAVILLKNFETGLHSPVSLLARRRPPVIASGVDRAKEDSPSSTGILVCQNARLTKNTAAGWSHVRAIRVLAGGGQTLRSSHSYIVHAGNTVTELGTVPLAADGSFAIEVPADTAIALQAVDAEGRSELNEMSWIFVRPGEKRGCVGCHQPRQVAPRGGEPLAGAPLAAKVKPVRLVPDRRPFQFRGNNPAVTGMMELQFDRFREIAGLNRHDGLPGDTGAAEVAALANVAAEGPDDQRIGAIQRLAMFRDPKAAPALASCLKSGDRELRLAAAMALASCGNRASVPALLDALADADPIVAQGAAVAVENLTGWRGEFDAFASADKRSAQIAAWRAACSPEAWPARQAELLDRLASGTRDQVRRAAVTLTHSGDASAVPALKAWFTAQRDVNPYPTWRAQGHVSDAAQFNSASAENPRTLQAVTRAMGRLGDESLVPLLAEALGKYGDPGPGNLFLAEACAEALGSIGTKPAEAALIAAFGNLREHWRLSEWYGDHPALMACHASPPHYLILEALDRLGSTQAGPVVPAILRSIPTDPDRLLAYGTDDYEALAGRVIRRSVQAEAVIETCLALLGDQAAKSDPALAAAISTKHGAWAGSPGGDIRAAQTLSALCRDKRYVPRLCAALDRWRQAPCAIKRVFDRGIPVVDELPARHWVSFFLARALGEMGDPSAADSLLAGLASEPEAAHGRPDPLGPGVLFLHNDLTPCWRAECAWALGRLGDRRAIAPLRAVITSDLNAIDTRYAAAVALVALSNAEERAELPKLINQDMETSIQVCLRRGAEM
ncbi:MAG: HEAT repeat domain-containing protein [Armatimonadetes bacterium]|nr:HEAT repeat domain-containing protein [Armatimonadota bacterium]